MINPKNDNGHSEIAIAATRDLNRSIRRVRRAVMATAEAGVKGGAASERAAIVRFLLRLVRNDVLPGHVIEAIAKGMHHEEQAL